ncbi:M1 family metallopeptidase [Psychroflexus planctonicus]|uniref:Peptidase M1 n=1 Tax=Psychroflexus planctonicus TaxID=1526575 RepID=A0ABQ1SI81_9FLAO|nr:M1 family metallopeptidase [Psychroflexus planctonicus]GGE38062.1 peptidase M1 [Psychroflexus planctonicus]
MKSRFFALFIVLFCVSILTAQNNTAYWQQHIDYEMEVDMDVETFQYTGKQTIKYTNNSPDELNRVFIHLYFNAFQPGSEMDVRSQSIQDADPRVGSRIGNLKPEEIGYLKVKNLKHRNKKVESKVAGTVLEITLNEPIAPGETTEFDLKFEGQVPNQIRRSGRNNAEGVALSMTQWYPKMAEYDFEGWHADPYIGREFQGVWGDFDVKIKIDKDYVIGGTGYLQNPNKIGHGYQDEGVQVKTKRKKLTWHFIAPMVHDFAWGADPDFIHDSFTAKDGTKLHFFYKDNPEIIENWKNLQPKTEDLLLFFNKHIGQYPYKQYSVIQGGDGGMEYAMCTLITGERSFGSLVGVTAHELAHSWFQHVLATNEAKHEWMDEGMTTYISSLAMNEVMNQKSENPFARSYGSYVGLANSGYEQPQTTHADRWEFNAAYGASAYSKGAVFLAQLEYLLGEELLQETLKEYFNMWKMKHPTPNDFIRVAEKVSGAQLNWYLTDWTQTTNTIDYAVENIEETDETTKITLKRLGLMPMPLEILVTYQDGSSEEYYIPLRMMRWIKPKAKNVQDDWAWAYPDYTLTIPSKTGVQKVEIDPSNLMADVKRDNNTKKK